MTELQARPTSLLPKYECSAILPLYTTVVRVSGGVARHARASGIAKSSDGALDVQLRLPKELPGWRDESRAALRGWLCRVFPRCAEPRRGKPQN